MSMTVEDTMTEIAEAITGRIDMTTAETLAIVKGMTKTLPLPPLSGYVALPGGIVLLVMDKRKG